MTDTIADSPYRTPGVRTVGANEAILNITHAGQNFELPDPIPSNAAPGDIRAWAAEAIRTGSVPGVPADPNVDLSNYVVEFFDRPASPAPGQRDTAIWMARPKVAFGA